MIAEGGGGCMDPASISRDLETDALEVLQILYAELSEDWLYMTD